MIVAAIALTLLLGGLFLVAPRVYVGLYSESWPQVPGVIIESGAVFSGYDDSGAPTFVSKIVYRYTVDKREYRCDILEALQLVLSREQVDRIALSYPPGKEVAVFYDPRNPRNAVLVPGIGPWTQVGLLVYVAICLMLAVKFVKGIM